MCCVSFAVIQEKRWSFAKYQDKKNMKDEEHKEIMCVTNLARLVLKLKGQTWRRRGKETVVPAVQKRRPLNEGTKRRKVTD